MRYEEISTEEYAGGTRLNFRLDGRDSIVVRPANPLPGNPTAWRAEFFGAFDSVDRALVERGWHVCYYKVSDMYGCDAALDMMYEFYKFVSEKFSLSNKLVMFGFSRGGLYSVNYAAKYHDHVCGLYLDAPVLDIRSWPCSDLESREAKECLECYDLTPDVLVNFNKNPIDKVAAVADLPIIIVAGDADRVVPYLENGAIFVEKLQKLGANVEAIIKPGCDHHPHSLDDPMPIVQFLEKNCL
ncbi:MAG: prolyl oligopeptidase family serine peptidase [Clostridiales bacterium]|nr:prolyl oligopeptidase family serine peptidase [Clostridiales bacterium]